MNGNDEPDATPTPAQETTIPENPVDKNKKEYIEPYYPTRHGHGDLIILGQKSMNEHDNQAEDIKKLSQLSEFLGAELINWTGKSSKEIMEAFKEFSTDKKREGKDFIIVFILSEAKHLNHIRGAAREDNKDDYYKLDDVLHDMAYGEGTKVLGIPKIFFVQNVASKGTDNISGGHQDDTKSTLCHRMADFFVSFNKEYDECKIDKTRFGSTYINLLDSEIRNAVKQGWGLFTTMTIVNRKLAEEYKNSQQKTMNQAPRFHSMLRYDFKFKAKNEN
ncbi:caspase-1-like [Ischnura elegans]|uniref:caspase-1-like n=1 Tax=Ischnura elegans TaxID=197161 RepID=UPI001ED88098|nr:caspase-1-like [Ischnura elegans]